VAHHELARLVDQAIARLIAEGRAEILIPPDGDPNKVLVRVTGPPRRRDEP
jgi:hypothetical protein